MRINIIRKSLIAILGGLYLLGGQHFLGAGPEIQAQIPSVQSCQGSNCPTYPLQESDNSLQKLVIYPVPEELDLIGENEVRAASSFTTGPSLIDVLFEAVVRVRAGRTCGSGTIVGRDQEGAAIVLTNAHVAGSVPGTSVQLERWDRNGLKHSGTATVIAGGYGRGTNVDFSLLRCEADFAIAVMPIPMADRLPDRSATVVTFGAPRCEWPSLQVLSWNRTDGPILTWAPEAISGRSGSGLFELTGTGPRVVGLLTWGGGGEGLGQASPFLLQVMRGQMPTSLQILPPDVYEVGTSVAQEVSSLQISNDSEVYQPKMRSLATPELDAEANTKTDSSSLSPDVPPVIIDAISEAENDHRWFGRNRDRDSNKGPIRRGMDTLQQLMATAGLIIVSGSAGYWLGKLTK